MFCTIQYFIVRLVIKMNYYWLKLCNLRCRSALSCCGEFSIYVEVCTFLVLVPYLLTHLQLLYNSFDCHETEARMKTVGLKCFLKIFCFYSYCSVLFLHKVCVVGQYFHRLFDDQQFRCILFLLLFH